MSSLSVKFLFAFVLLFSVISTVFAQSEKQKKVELRAEKERTQFKELLLQNPNYFGNVTDKAIADKYPAVTKITFNDSYEKLLCVGLYPENNVLEAVIEIKRPYGFKGPLCEAGSKEYVGFYVDYNDGAGFVSVGAPAEVNVHDISFVNSEHLFYAVRKAFTPLQYTECDTPQIVQVRAILSWEDPPTGPDYPPVWGNVVNTWVQIKPIEQAPVLSYIPIPIPYFDLIDIPGPVPPFPPMLPFPEEEIIPFEPIPSTENYMFTGNKEEIRELIERSLEAEKRIKQEGKVEPERFDFKTLLLKNPNYFGSISASKDSSEIMKAVYQLPFKTQQALLAKLEINPNWLIPVLQIPDKTRYEQLTCVGLYPEEDLLEAIIAIKLPDGYNGDLCTMGSTEYVAFYIDWGDGVYQHEATATVNVHDIPAVAGRHLSYAVKARIQNIESRLQDCTIENIVRVKAILSWNVDPTPFGPDHTPPWGNVLVRNVQIRPLNGSNAQCYISVVNEVPVDHISQSGSDAGYAIKAGSSGPLEFDRPFGGVIACWGNINVPGAAVYRFSYSENGGASWTFIRNRRTVPQPSGPPINRVPDPQGWLEKGDYDDDVAYYPIAPLIQWRSGQRNGRYMLRLELADAARTPLPGQTYEITLMLDNTKPELLAFGDTPSLPASGVTVKDADGEYRRCGEFSGNDAIRIFGNFRDAHFRYFRLKVFGGNITSTGFVLDCASYDPGISGILGSTGIIGAGSGSLGRQIGTLDLCTIPQSPTQIRCAYGIKLYLADRAIVGRLRNQYEFWTTDNHRDVFVTFNWDPAGCSGGIMRSPADCP